MLCQYKDLFGKVGEGVHSLRIFDIAVVDLGLTILIAYLIHLFLKYDFLIVFIVLFLSGILLHRIFCVRTTIDKLLF